MNYNASPPAANKITSRAEKIEKVELAPPEAMKNLT
jgi:hypothetical protein